MFEPDDALHAYDDDLEITDETRLARILRIKQSIQKGQYDVDGEFQRLVRNLSQQMSDTQFPETPDDDDEGLP